MIIEYCESKLNPGNYTAIIDNVTVATWNGTKWIDKGIYRPFRESLNTKIEWTGTPYDPNTLFSQTQLQIVKETGLEAINYEEQ